MKILPNLNLNGSNDTAKKSNSARTARHHRLRLSDNNNSTIF